VEKSRFTDEAAYPEIRDALRSYGLEIGAVAPAQAAARVRGRPKSVRRELIAALLECFEYAPRGDAPAQWLLDTLAATDDDAWRVRVRKTYLDRNWSVMEQLASEADVNAQPTSFLLFVATDVPAQTRASRLEFLRRIQRAHPADLWANHHLAFELFSNGQSEEAIRYYTAALALRPDSPGIYLNRGRAFHQARELDAAIADYRKAIDLDPKYAEAHGNLGGALRDKNQLDEAIAEFRKVIDLDPKNARFHFNLGTFLHHRNQLDEAIAEYKKSIDLDPNFAGAHSNLANALVDRNRLDEAIAEHKKATELDPKSAIAHNSLGYVDGAGNVYIADAGNNAIKEWTAAGRYFAFTS
jgi:Flp pilus assembly protein TadD